MHAKKVVMLKREQGMLPRCAGRQQLGVVRLVQHARVQMQRNGLSAYVQLATTQDGAAPKGEAPGTSHGVG